MSSYNELQHRQEDILRELMYLREQYKKAVPGMKILIADKGKALHKQLDEIKRDIGIYERIEKGHQIAKEIHDKKALRKGGEIL